MKLRRRRGDGKSICNRKQRWSTHNAAHQAARAHWAKVYVYRCRYCDGFHVTSQHPETRRIAGERMLSD